MYLVSEVVHLLRDLFTSLADVQFFMLKDGCIVFLEAKEPRNLPLYLVSTFLLFIYFIFWFFFL